MRVRVGLRLAVASLAATSLVLASDVAVAENAASAGKSPATWRTWYLTSPRQLRLAAPPAATSATTRAELRELRALQGKRTAANRRLITRWNSRPAVVPWAEIGLKQIADFRPRPPFSARVLALLHTGMYDAMVAAYESRAAYAGRTRPVPAKLDRRFRPAVATKELSSYASPEAAMAGAAETVLAHLFPGAPPGRFTKLADECVRSRLLAGLNYRSDLTRARELGRKVAKLVIARAEADGSTGTSLPHPRRQGEPYWEATPPTYEAPVGGPVGSWKTWLLGSPGELRHLLPGPSPYGSPQFMAELREVVDVKANLTEEQRRIAFFWDDGPGSYTPAGHWFELGIDLLKTYKLGAAETTRVFALLGAASADAVIAAWEAKYYWWSIRPITVVWRLCDAGVRLCTEAELAANPARATYRGNWFSLIITPAFPAYPSGHATFSGAGGRILSRFFPRAAGTINQFSDEAAVSRLYGGIHFDEDNRDGLILGRAIADLAIRWAERDR